MLNHIAGERFHAESAGLEPGTLNPLAVTAMKRLKIDISKNPTRDVFELYKRGGMFSYVITVCDESSGERCPLFPGIAKRIHWSFDDPASFTGPYEERLARTIQVRDQIKERIQDWLKEIEH